MDTRDWSKCFLCQDDRDGEKISIPSKAVTITDAKLKECFSDQIKLLIELEELGELPDEINVSDVLVLGRNDSVDLMIHHKKDLRWHKSCRLLVNNAEVERLRKKKRKSESNYSPVKKTRSHSRPDSAQSLSIRNLRSSNVSSSVEYSPKCFICDTDNGARLWQAATFGLNSRVKYCANVTKNEKLLRKFVDGDLIAIEAEYHVGCLSKLY